MFDWIMWDGNAAIGVFIRILISFLLALPIGWERERNARSLGLRTFPLVAVASTAYLTIAEELFVQSQDAQSRVLQGLMAGIGFIGGGAILKRNDSTVEGTATAAGVWATGALGASVAYGRLDIALAISLITFFTFGFITPLKQAIDRQREESGKGGNYDA
ncbi:MAG TPA: MgtC/SapB family protein [Gemmatimonadales bacterium]|nr:MgtC/SapB family protein [Gemmatimonadales bacterium]